MANEFEARQCDACGEVTPVDEWEIVETDPETHPFGDDGYYVCPCCGQPLI